MKTTPSEACAVIQPIPDRRDPDVSRALPAALAVTLLLAGVTLSQATNGPDGSLVFNGQDGPPPNVVTLSPPYAITMSVSGPSNLPFVLARADALAPGAVPVGSETLDVDPGSLSVVMNGLSFSSFINLLASTGPTGTATFTLPLDPSVPPGSLGAFQAAIFDPALPNPGFALTAATELLYSRPACDFGRITFGSGPTWDSHAVSAADGATGLSALVPGLSGALELQITNLSRPREWNPGSGDLRRFDTPSTTPRLSGINRDIRFIRTLHGDLYHFIDHGTAPIMSGLMIVPPGGGEPRVIPGTLAPTFGSAVGSRWAAYETAQSYDASTIAVSYNDYPNPDRMFLIRIDGGTFAANGLEVLDVTPPGATQDCRRPRFVGQDFIFSTYSTIYRTTQDPTTPATSIPLPVAGPFGSVLSIGSSLVHHPVTNSLFFFVGNNVGDYLKLDLATNTLSNLTAQTTAAGNSALVPSLVTGQFALSPNGMWFAYIAGNFNSRDLYLMRTDGTGAPIQVTSSARFAQNLDDVRYPDFWSDDDVMFYVGSYDIVMDVYNFNLTTGVVTNVTGTNGQSQIPFSANGTIRPEGFFKVPGGAVHMETYGVMFGIDYASLTSYNITGSDVGGAPGPAVTRHSVSEGELCYAPGANIIWFTGSESGNAKVYTFIPGIAAPATAQTSISATEFTNLVPDVSGTFCLVARRDPGGDEEPGVVVLGSGYTQLASDPSPFNEVTDGTLHFLDPSAPCAGIVYSQGTAVYPNTTRNPTDAVIRGVDAIGRVFHVSSLPAAHWIYGVGQ